MIHNIYECIKHRCEYCRFEMRNTYDQPCYICLFTATFDCQFESSDIVEESWKTFGFRHGDIWNITKQIFVGSVMNAHIMILIKIIWQNIAEYTEKWPSGGTMKCDIPGCIKEMDKFDPVKSRTDGIAIQVLSTNRIYLICIECAKKLGFIREEKKWNTKYINMIYRLV